MSSGLKGTGEVSVCHHASGGQSQSWAVRRRPCGLISEMDEETPPLR